MPKEKSDIECAIVDMDATQGVNNPTDDESIVSLTRSSRQQKNWIHGEESQSSPLYFIV